MELDLLPGVVGDGSGPAIHRTMPGSRVGAVGRMGAVRIYSLTVSGERSTFPAEVQFLPLYLYGENFFFLQRSQAWPLDLRVSVIGGKTDPAIERAMLGTYVSAVKILPEQKPFSRD